MSLSAPAHSAANPLISVVALDLDGTILEPDEKIHGDVLDLLRLLSDRGIRCVTATGRPIDFQLELLARYNRLEECFSALIADERELYIRRDGTLDPDRKWNSWIRVRWQARTRDALRLIHEAHQEADRRGMTARIATTEEVASRGLASLRFDDEAQAETICAWLAGRLATAPGRLACNRNTTNVQVYDSAAGKAAVLSRLAKVWQLRPERILAIGDSSNDQDMLDGSHGFRCATVANAAEQVKAAVQAASGYVAYGRSGAGVVEAIRAVVPEASDRWLERETETHADRAY